MARKKLVDLCTNSQYIQEIVLTEYTEKFFPDKQHIVDDFIPESHVFNFYRMPISLIKFLKERDSEFSIKDEYDFKESETGKFVIARIQGKLVEDNNEFLEVSYERLTREI